ncbi:MAG: TIGR03032 family protein, partial [Acidimicrobiales bacterium]
MGSGGAAEGTGFTSEATASFAALLASTGSSVLVSTYQSRRLIVLRELDGVVNTHFLAFESPMGIATQGPDLALAAGRAVWRFRDRPALLDRLDPPGRHDACFVPGSAHVTGDVRGHDLAFGDDGLWLVATLFSCLATVDAGHSFVPRWRPPFVSALAADDRCHLNGLAMVDGRPGFVTCFGPTDEGGGWRAGGATRDGMVIDVASSETVAAGLCMPHSPRWHDGRLWLLESGRGTLCVVDPSTGAVETVAKLPGFTRGLSFLGPWALVGLSLVRETVFDGAPVKEGDRSCGVWAVDTRTGHVGGWLRFSGAVQELYDVQALPGRRFATVLEP